MQVARLMAPLLAMLACTREGPPARPPEPAAVIHLVRLQGFVGKDPTWRLHPDGRLESVELDEAGGWTGGWLPGPRLAADGTIHFPKPDYPQEVSARVTPRGEIIPCPGQPAWGRIEGDRVTVAGSGTEWLFRIDAAARLTLSGSALPPERIDGAVDARSRRTALVAYAAMFLSLAAMQVGEGGATWCP
jgi:hypothetical protein